MDLLAGAIVAVVIYSIAPYACRVVMFSGETRRWFTFQKEI
jgi:hypothetical protein